jgi:hypothetical protein
VNDLNRNLLIQHLRNALVPVNNNLVLPQALLDRVLAAEDLGQFLQRALLGLDEEEVDEDEFEGVPEDEEEVVFPAGAREGDAGDEGVIETSDVDPKL